MYIQIQKKTQNNDEDVILVLLSLIMMMVLAEHLLFGAFDHKKATQTVKGSGAQKFTEPEVILHITLPL